ncbi:uncharacterized protein LOC129579599 [Sitodiplosis mosellana]|uniref:uncharacterized protein LOC129579599 n=1 Tax=Sitodiplosis mosellana TaxID=263140 RepID=UPI002443C676|nr:uncharacterized protein LOC129579599 [Sitodiplosis mosellana]
MIDMNITADFFIIDDQTVDARPLNYLLQKTDDDSDFVPAEINITKDVAFFNYTSGSTGNPKTVPLTHANVLDKLRKYSALIEVGDTMLGWAHFRGISGVRFLISGTLSGARRVVNQGAFTPERFFKLVQEFNVNVTFLNDSSQIHQLLKHPQIKTADLSSLKMLHCAGTIVPLHFIEKMNSHLGSSKFCNSFGMTETCGTVAINLYHSKNNCTGQLIGDCEAKIVNEQGDRLGVNESGELYLKDPFMFEGYLGDDGNASQHFDREGFFRTGDIAHFDENSDLFITDRKKELFKYMGYHIIPNEIQQFLDQIDGVDESCVVPVPISKYVLAPAAVIIKTKNSACTEEFIYDAVSNSFADHKRLRGGVYFVNSIPRTATGKVNRRLVAEMALKFYKDKNMVKRNN